MIILQYRCMFRPTVILTKLYNFVKSYRLSKHAIRHTYLCIRKSWTNKSWCICRL